MTEFHTYNLAPSFDTIDVQNVNLHGGASGQVHVVVDAIPGNIIELGAVNTSQYLVFVYLDFLTVRPRCKDRKPGLLETCKMSRKSRNKAY